MVCKDFFHLYSNRNPAFPLNNTNTFHFVTDMKPYFMAISTLLYNLYMFAQWDVNHQEIELILRIPIISQI